MQLLDRDSFPDENSISSDRVRPFVVRTEKRLAIDAEGKPLFKPRVTRTQAVAWLDRHSAQQGLYEAVTEYVRHGYNQAMASKQRHIGFLMILMQRLVTSSTAAIRATLESRLLALESTYRQLWLVVKTLTLPVRHSVSCNLETFSNMLPLRHSSIDFALQPSQIHTPLPLPYSFLHIP